MAYRGDGEASAERLAALDAEIAGLEARLTPIFWERAAPVFGIDPPSKRPLGSLEARHDRIARLEATLERARHAPAAAPELPRRGPPPEGVLASIGEALSFAPAEILDAARDAARAHAADVSLDYRSYATWSARFRAREAPIDLTIAIGKKENDSSVFATVETTVAPAAVLRLDPEGILEDLLETLGLRREVELGDPSFDPVFLIRGDAPSARALLTADVRRALLAVNAQANLRATVRDGLARIRCAAQTREVFARMIEVAARWHATPSPHALLVER
ncbi:MAG: hypothetical protein KF729_00295 [Sandaracinaceae bacterium]|nr:hypothetical protein [Sandaracinaceae bacterium]